MKSRIYDYMGTPKIQIVSMFVNQIIYLLRSFLGVCFFPQLQYVCLFFYKCLFCSEFPLRYFQYFWYSCKLILFLGVIALMALLADTVFVHSNHLLFTFIDSFYCSRPRYMPVYQCQVSFCSFFFFFFLSVYVILVLSIFLLR